MIKQFYDDITQTFIVNQIRIERLEKSLPHSSGTIVKKGELGERIYWQYRKAGRQIQEPIKQITEEELIKEIKIYQHREAKLRELKSFQKILSRILKSGGIDSGKVWIDYKNSFLAEQMFERKLQQAKQIAKQKRYSNNYKHQTDKGDLVASKSEEMIANMLFAMDIKYEYEKELILNGSKVLPDFIIHKKDGTQIIWEHAGLLENEEYADRFSKKLKIYEYAGFTRQNNLIVTRDVDGSFASKDIRRVIEIYNLEN